ncbi:ATP-binding cassette domain-containing protein [Verrucomicrobiales bacterium]|nr:ATP-binding cassette domain-containing protein [Verrucomicrobiales bacterium]MDB4657761.1 ATP-binding cassette domain-containing protein [Verrucomicrobiales bacterium]MDC0275669.1 ATP-binding cassette domain-containing protein [Verrucomicrobiales bacterium]
MLELKDIFFTIQKDDEDVHLIDAASISVPQGHFMAIVGPSGCGKSTLLKLVAGINIESDGNIFWEERDLSEDGDLEPSEIGYVPQFSIAYENLTVEENIESAVRLRVKTRGRDEFYDLVDKVLMQTGMEPIRSRPVKVLSGGQKRRLSLALELVTEPVLLLADEVTSGLDPKSENEIVKLLHQLSRKQNRIVMNVTHSLANLELYDSVLVLHEGKVVYHGQPRALDHYFNVEEAEDVYPRLAKRSSTDWQKSWNKHKTDYYSSMLAASAANQTPPPPPVYDEEGQLVEQPKVSRSAQTPGMLAQFFALFFRRCKNFVRDGGQLTLQIAIMIGFPILVILFDLDGVDQLERLRETLPQTPADFKQDTEVITKNLNLAGLVSGLVMFQVVLLTLMGSNNSAREIAGERPIFEKEKLGGVRPLVYIVSKVAFLSIFVFIQSLWMAAFVDVICEIPAPFMAQFSFLFLVNAAMTAICLGISAQARTADQASLLSIYLVGFQLPLSGAVLALPELVGWITRPFISAYWSWAGVVDSLDANYLEYVKDVTDTPFVPGWICAVVLLAHVMFGLILAYVGVKKPRWQH